MKQMEGGVTTTTTTTTTTANGESPEAEKEEETNNDTSSLYLRMLDVVKEELEDSLRPELLNRMDEIVVFSPLGTDDLSAIARLLLERTVERARTERDMTLEIGEGLVDRVRVEGSADAATFGARPMRRAAQRFLEDTISDALLRGFLSEGDSATVDIGKIPQGGGGGDKDRCTVIITRESDGKHLEVPVEDASGGIGSSRPRAQRSQSVNGDVLETEPAMQK